MAGAFHDDLRARGDQGLYIMNGLRRLATGPDQHRLQGLGLAQFLEAGQDLAPHGAEADHAEPYITSHRQPPRPPSMLAVFDNIV